MISSRFGQVLRYVWNHPSNKPPLRSEIGGRYWGTMGRYVYRNFIRGIADECGHEYEHLFEESLGSAGPEAGELVDSETAAIERGCGLALAAIAVSGSGDEVSDGEDEGEKDGPENRQN